MFKKRFLVNLYLPNLLRYTRAGRKNIQGFKMTTEDVFFWIYIMDISLCWRTVVIIGRIDFIVPNQFD